MDKHNLHNPNYHTQTQITNHQFKLRGSFSRNADLYAATLQENDTKCKKYVLLDIENDRMQNRIQTFRIIENNKNCFNNYFSLQHFEGQKMKYKFQEKLYQVQVSF